ncbi:unnamed protein product [Rhizoctonia solani]|uniref:Uncharacterized protein n=1 Tax=Rhizoctonia solani TaxID=456999 RepID=A0A8H3BIW8_9AGAM|nr:unnamed protein product [Rhizoctonia solani]
MSLAPGTYLIHVPDSKQALCYYHLPFFSDKIGTWYINNVDILMWYVKPYPGSPMYAIQNVYYKKYIAVGVDGSEAYGAEENNAAVLELEGPTSSCLIKLAGTNRRLEHPNIKSTPQGHTLVNFTDKVALQDSYWSFEKIGYVPSLRSLGYPYTTSRDDNGGNLKPIPKNPTFTSPASQPNNLLPPNSGSMYTDDAHFYTDMLFNMPRTPFTRTQRIAALDWARKLGATNVPTMESFDECERRLETASGSSDAGKEAE